MGAMIGPPRILDNRTVPLCSFPWLVARPFPCPRYWPAVSRADEEAAAPAYMLGSRCARPGENHLHLTTVRAAAG